MINTMVFQNFFFSQSNLFQLLKPKKPKSKQIDQLAGLWVCLLKHPFKKSPQSFPGEKCNAGVRGELSLWIPQWSSQCSFDHCKWQEQDVPEIKGHANWCHFLSDDASEERDAQSWKIHQRFRLRSKADTSSRDEAGWVVGKTFRLDEHLIIVSMHFLH